MIHRTSRVGRGEVVKGAFYRHILLLLFPFTVSLCYSHTNLVWFLYGFLPGLHGQLVLVTYLRQTFCLRPPDPKTIDRVEISQPRFVRAHREPVRRSYVGTTGFLCRSQVIVLPIPKQPKPLTNANLKLTLGLNTLMRLALIKGLGCFTIGKTMMCDR